MESCLATVLPFFSVIVVLVGSLLGAFLNEVKIMSSVFEFGNTVDRDVPIYRASKLVLEVVVNRFLVLESEIVSCPRFRDAKRLCYLHFCLTPTLSTTELSGSVRMRRYRREAFTGPEIPQLLPVPQNGGCACSLCSYRHIDLSYVPEPKIGGVKGMMRQRTGRLDYPMVTGGDDGVNDGHDSSRDDTICLDRRGDEEDAEERRERLARGTVHLAHSPPLQPSSGCPYPNPGTLGIAASPGSQLLLFYCALPHLTTTNTTILSMLSPVVHRDDIPGMLKRDDRGLEMLVYGIWDRLGRSGGAVSEIAPMSVSRRLVISQRVDMDPAGRLSTYGVIGWTIQVLQELQTHRDHVYDMRTYLQAHQTRHNSAAEILSFRHNSPVCYSRLAFRGNAAD
ncbi:hypothetical protein Tco_1400901 [Tanacetum coccineum]